MGLTRSLAKGILCLGCFVGISKGNAIWSQSSERVLPSTNASDATLRACSASSADRIWMVGDRGLILASDNGGRTWLEQESETTSNLEGVAFDNDSVGWAVGGSVLPYSHRSAGILLTTHDGGQHWRSIGAPELPRLKGLHSFGGGHLIVWGDWSPTLQTALMESFDGGGTWSPRVLPASHLQSCAWHDAKRGIVIDRLSRVFYLSGNNPPELLSIGGDPTRPLVSAAINEAGWWLVGECGQVYWSSDGRSWLERQLPGNARDHRLISIQGLALKGEHVWLVGVPGNVVWHSSNRGIDWDVQKLSTSLPMHCICVSKQDCLIAGGMLANIQGTRNLGQGWWPIHSAGSRIALFNIATTIDQLAWDALAYLSTESRHQAAAFVIHEQHVHERADAHCDGHHRIEGLANPLGISALKICSQYPVGDMPIGRRANECTAYAEDAKADSNIARTLALWIRMVRPDTIVSDEKKPDDPLLVASADAVKLARRLASESTFHCFSDEAGIAEPPWNCKRVLARICLDSPPSPSTLKRRSEVHFASTTALKSTGKLLSDVLAPVVPTMASYLESGSEGFQILEARLYADYNTIYGVANKSGKDHLLAEMSHSVDTKRPQLRSRQANLQTMLAGSQQAVLLARMLEMKGLDLPNDVRWHASLKSFLRSIPTEQHMDSLWQLAQGYRHQGYWNRWRVCLDSLITEAPRSGAAELACLQQLQFLGSDEVSLLRSQAASSQANTDGKGPKMIQSATISSPFAQEVKLASHSLKQSATHISPAEEYSQIQQTVPIRFPVLQWDPRYLATAAAFHRNPSMDQRLPTALHSSPLQRMASSHALVGWHAIGIQELQADIPGTYDERPTMPSTGNQSSLAFPIRTVEGRPKLDGQFEEQVWQSSATMQLESVWIDDPNLACDVKMIHDGEFLFIGVASRRSTLGHSDQQHRQPERLTIRFDTDRDYLTWFELQVDEAGQATERCTDMESWQPEWYFKTVSEDTGWRLEAAVPISQLQSEAMASNGVWAMAIHRAIPNQGVQTNRAMYADRLLLTSPTLVRFCADDDSK